MNKLFVLVFMFLSGISMAQEEVNANQFGVVNKIRFIENEKEPFSGKFRDFNSAGVLIKEENWVGGFREGVEKSYDAKGQLTEVRHLKKGALDGVLTKYADGVLVSNFYYSQESLDSIVWYYPNGDVSERSRYKNRRIEGLQSKYYTSGQLSLEEEYVGGKLSGKKIMYYENGKIEQKAIYKENKLNGFFKRYYKNGQLSLEENYKDGIRNGVKNDYYEEGQLRVECNYVDGKLDGVFKRFYENGQLVREAYCEKDVIVGEVKDYYKDGKLQQTIKYKDGRAYGEIVNYNYEGIISKKVIIGEGEVMDKVIRYDDKGKPIVPKKDKSGFIMPEIDYESNAILCFPPYGGRLERYSNVNAL